MVASGIDSAVLQLLGVCFVAGAVGGFCGALVGWGVVARVLHAAEVRVGVSLLAPAPVVLPVSVPVSVVVTAPAAISVPVEAEIVRPVGGAGAANVDLVRRMILEDPGLGVRQVARILDVSPSTALSYCQAAARSVPERLAEDAPAA